MQTAFFMDSGFCWNDEICSKPGSFEPERNNKSNKDRVSLYISSMKYQKELMAE